MPHYIHIKKITIALAAITASSLSAAGAQASGVINGSFSDTSSGEWKHSWYHIPSNEDAQNPNVDFKVTIRSEGSRNAFAHLELYRSEAAQQQAPTQAAPTLSQNDIVLAESCRMILLQFDYRATSDKSFYGLEATVAAKVNSGSPLASETTKWASRSSTYDQAGDEHAGWTTAQMTLGIPAEYVAHDGLAFDVAFALLPENILQSSNDGSEFCEPEYAIVELDQISLQAINSSGSEINKTALPGCGTTFNPTQWWSKLVTLEIAQTVTEPPVDPIHAYLDIDEADCYFSRATGCLSNASTRTHTYTPSISSCEGDLNANGVTNGADLTILLSNWGSDDPLGDLNCDGVIGGADLTILLSNWGRCRTR